MRTVLLTRFSHIFSSKEHLRPLGFCDPPPSSIFIVNKWIFPKLHLRQCPCFLLGHILDRKGSNPLSCSSGSWQQWCNFIHPCIELTPALVFWSGLGSTRAPSSTTRPARSRWASSAMRSLASSPSSRSQESASSGQVSLSSLFRPLPWILKFFKSL